MSPNLRIKLNKRLKSDGGRISAGEKTLEREGESSNFSLRSTEIGWSEFVGLRTKVNLLNEGYAWLPKTRYFAEEFGKSKASGLGSVHGTS